MLIKLTAFRAYEPLTQLVGTPARDTFAYHVKPIFTMVTLRYEIPNIKIHFKVVFFCFLTLPLQILATRSNSEIKFCHKTFSEIYQI